MARRKRPGFAKLDARQFAKMRRSPALFLSFCCLCMALRSEYLLVRGHPATVVVIAESAIDLGIHEKAAQLLLLGRDPEGRYRVDPDVFIWVIQRSLRDRHEFVRHYGRHRVILVLARNREELPIELVAAADAVLDLPKPTAAHIIAARSLLGRGPIDGEVAEQLAGTDVCMLAPLVAKHRLELEHARILRSQPLRMDSTDEPCLEDLPGYGEVKPWAQSFADDVERWRRGQIGWHDLDRGILLHGPPGTGKTLFAQALAKSCGVPLVAGSLAQWQAQGHLGDLLKAMRAAFDKARSLQPAIIFIDELDSFGDRSQFSGHNAQYQREVVNALLECIDGIRGRQGILVVAATNDLQAIDQALLRGGRIERHVRIDLPDAEERGEILAFHLRSSVSVEALRGIVEDLAGWSGADLERLAREARRQARAAGRPVDLGDVVEALPPLQALPENVAHRVAIHESAHAVVALALEPNRKVGVVIRKQFRTSSTSPVRGQTRFFSHERTGMETRDSLDTAICIALGGAAAEEVLLGARSTGSGGSKGSDLDVATTIATQIVCWSFVPHGRRRGRLQGHRQA